MKTQLEQVRPMDIERRSFELITEELPHPIDEKLAPIIKRVIHTTADFEYADSLYFSPEAMEKGLAAIQKGASIVTDTTMALSGINKRMLAKHGGKVYCFIADEDVAAAAKQKGSTRSAESMEKAADLEGPLIFAIGNAPTALIRICDLIREKRLDPALVIGVPVGFVNVTASKELLMETETPCIVARGRKGGSNVAAAICNALIYMLGREAGEA